NLTNEGYTLLDNFCGNLTSQSVDYAEITTYVDSEGDAISTDEISLQRSSLVKEYIRRKIGVAEKFIKVKGQQKTPTAIENSSAKPKKRRMELIIYMHE
ncbi:MAG: hypothetical protein JSS70_10970, partial [Bacteroidetes bacterium]|nr:hypothetical protein [Bacteroidota bacterium]